MPSTEYYLDKADHLSADLVTGGALQPEMRARFYRVAMKESKLFGMIRTEEMNAPEMRLDKLIAPETVFQPGTEGVVLPDAARSKLGTDSINMVTHELVAEAQWSYNIVEDNIERNNWGNLVVDTIGKVARLNWEDLLINGDKSIVVPAYDPNDAASIRAWKRARLLKSNDGLLARVNSNVVDAGGQRLHAGLLKSSVQTMEEQFRDGAMRFFTSSNAVSDYWESIASRQTALGDQAFQSTGEAPFQGRRVTPLMFWPGTLGVDADRTSAVLIDPKNIVWGVQRDMTVDTMKDIRRRMYILVMTCRVAMNLEHEPASVRIDDIKNSPDV